MNVRNAREKLNKTWRISIVPLHDTFVYINVALETPIKA